MKQPSILVLLFLSNQSYSQEMIGIYGGSNQSFFHPSEGYVVNQCGEAFTSYQCGIFIKHEDDNLVHNGFELNYRRKSSDLLVYTSTSLAHSNYFKGRINFDYCSLMFLPEFRTGDRNIWNIKAQ